MSSSSASRSNMQQTICRIILVGGNGTEEKNITKSKTRSAFETADENYMPSIGVDFILRKTGDAIFQIWDTAGQERFRNIALSYYQNAGAILICPASVQDFQDWSTRVEIATHNPLIVVTNDLDVKIAAQQMGLHVMAIPTRENADQYLLEIYERTFRKNVRQSQEQQKYPLEKYPLFFSSQPDAKSFLEADTLTPDERRARENLQNRQRWF
jgi:GTPase SAR1 family protein